MNSNDRTATIRARVLTRKHVSPPDFVCTDPVLAARSLRASEDTASWQVRRGMLARDRLASLRFDIDDAELLAGRLHPVQGDTTDVEREEAQAYLATYDGPRGQTGHCELFLAHVMGHGVDGVADDIRVRMEAADGERRDAYESFLLALEGFSAMIERAAACAKEAAGLAPEGRREELRAMAESCGRIAHEPPATFRDAIQLVWFAIFGVMHGDQVGLVVPGHLDRVLARFYDADVARGTLTRDDALELIECLYLLVNDYVPDGLAMSVMVGGRDANGKDV
ncbi:MAG: hypothetical protein GY851_26790, partial [bacterium]|nr:hypothetical protein [bacterium]